MVVPLITFVLVVWELVMIDSVAQPSAVLKLVVNSVTSAAIVLPVKRAAATREKSLIFFMVVKILEFVIRVYLEFVMIAENLQVGYNPKMKIRSCGVNKEDVFVRCIWCQRAN